MRRAEWCSGRRLICSSEERLETEAHRPEVLVPITVDFDVQGETADAPGIKIKDRFLWNINGELLLRMWLNRRKIHHPYPIRDDILRRYRHRPEEACSHRRRSD